MAAVEVVLHTTVHLSWSLQAGVVVDPCVEILFDLFLLQFNTVLLFLQLLRVLIDTCHETIDDGFEIVLFDDGEPLIDLLNFLLSLPQ